MAIEIWRPINDFEGLYEISDLGSVKNLLTNQLLVQTKDSRGNLHVGLYKNNKIEFRLVHRLVAQTFIKNLKHKPFVKRKDGNKLNNQVSNLEWSGQKQYPKVVEKNSGEKHHNAKLTAKEVLEIRETYIDNRHELAREYSVDESTIRNIITRRTWKLI